MVKSHNSENLPGYLPSPTRWRADLHLPAETNYSTGFWNALQDLMSSGNSLDTLIQDWNSHLSEAINKVAPGPPPNSCSKPPPWYNLELTEMKQEVRRLKQVWGCAYMMS